MAIFKKLRALFNKKEYCPNGELHSFSYRFVKGGGRIKTCVRCGYKEHID